MQTSLRVPKTAELIAGRIRTRIIRGELKPGDSLANEDESLQGLGVSRHVLREAYRILESERLLTIRRGAGGGPRVLEPDPHVAARHVGTLLQWRGTTLIDVQRSRIALEPLAVRWLAESDDRQAAVDELTQYNDKLRTMIDGHPDDFAVMAFNFHRRIVELSGNQTLSVLMSVVSDIIELHITNRTRMQYTSREESAESSRRAVKANTRLLSLLASGSADEAEAFWRTHVAAIAEYLEGPDGPVTVLELLD